jgi:predicted SnoaL-like aldol condensation-catalyzing enzyme
LSQQVVARYFEMWNTGDSSMAVEVLSPDWVDHAHPEVSGPEGVQQAVEKARASQPNLHFQIDAMLGDGDLVAVVGSVGIGSGPARSASRLIWLVRLEGGDMTEMWTYRGETV